MRIGGIGPVTDDAIEYVGNRFARLASIPPPTRAMLIPLVNIMIITFWYITLRHLPIFFFLRFYLVIFGSILQYVILWLSIIIIQMVFFCFCIAYFLCDCVMSSHTVSVSKTPKTLRHPKTSIDRLYRSDSLCWCLAYAL